MNNKISFKKRIIISFSLIIAVFTAGIILFEQNQIKKERINSLEYTLEKNADIIYKYIKNNNIAIDLNAQMVSQQLQYMEPDLRLTIIDWQGNILYDNLLNEQTLENHLKRPEIQKSITFGEGSNIRLSNSNNIKYLYYAKKYEEGFFIRMALPYDLKLQSFINSDNSFIYFILLFLVVCVLMMLYFTNRFTKSIRELREFSLSIKKGRQIPADIKFTDDEVGEVSADIVENYNMLQENRLKLVTEREKLLQHFQLSEDGIAIFSEDRKKLYTNSHFLQYLNVILDKPTLEVEQLFSESSFTGIVDFIHNNNRNNKKYTQRFNKGGKQFNVSVIIFEDNSFELYISDITKSEKTRQLKQEMTNNIAHELRTPVTSIRGYLETILSLYKSQIGDEQGKIENFLERAYSQTIRLSELIQDISMLTKIEEASDRFELDLVNIFDLLQDLKSDLFEEHKEKNYNFIIDVPEEVVIYGNHTLFYSIFRNLIENSLSYAGENVEIVIRCNGENDVNYFFEFYDNGVGVEDKHLVRIFERFYRVNEGRTRNNGGSGLGLSIVKNAVLFHKGNIIAKNRPEGGLYFLITFPKKNK